MAVTRTFPNRLRGMERVPALLVLLAMFAPLAIAGRAPAAGEGDSRLTGRWIEDDEFLKKTIVFLPDGRYVFTYRTGGGTELHERGRYAVEGGKLTFRPEEGEAEEYEMELRKEKLILTHPKLTLNLALEPGSRRGVLDEAAQADAAKAKEDTEWAKRFPLAKAAPRPNLAVGDLPRDPDPKRVFDGDPTVFGTHVSYVRFWNPSVTYHVVQGPDPGSGKAQTQWHFLPNGRFFTRNISYVVPGGAEGEFQRGRVAVTDHWGRYRVDKDDKGREVMTLESDAGEKVTQELIDGRRNLRWGDKSYGNTLWELYALQKQEGKDLELPPVPEQ